jgi:hypothetical protein
MINNALIPYNPTKIVAVEEYFPDDVEYYLLRAYSQAFFKNGPPDFFDIFDNFQEQILMENKKILLFNSMIMSKYEITMELLEYTLEKVLKCEFVTMQGEHVNSSQNVLIEEMLS